MSAFPSHLGILPCLAAMLVAGCSLLTRPENPPTRFFVLTGQHASGLDAGADDRSGFAVGIGPFVFPSYLQRAQMVNRDAPNQIAFSQFDRWAEPIDSGFLRVLAEDVSRRVGTHRVALFPWYQTPLDYQVKGEVLRFETNSEGKATLHCIWTIYDLVEKRYLVTRSSQLQRSVPAGDPEEIAAALSALVGELADEIAAEPTWKRHRAGKP